MTKNRYSIIKKGIASVLMLAGGLLTAQEQQPEALCNKVIVGYWHSFDNKISTVIKLRDVPCYYNVINISFLEGASPSDPSVVFRLDPAVETEEELISDIKICKARGQKVLASIGGQNGAIHLPDEAAKTKFVNSLIQVIDKFGIEGLDLDIEGGAVVLAGGDNDYKNPTSAVIKNLISACKTVKAKYGSNFWITAAPEIAYVQGGNNAYSNIWGAYLPIFYGLRNELNYVHVQYYNAGGNSGSDGNNYNQGTADFIVAMSDMLLSGFKMGNGQTFEPLREDQVAFGLPATTGAAPAGGYLALAEVTKALDYLTKGISFAGGKYKLSKSFPNLRGIMTWSVNWDNIPSSNYAFGKTFSQYFCGSTNLCSSSTGIGSVENEERALNVFPNPSTGVINIDLDASLISSIQLFNIYGQEVYHENIAQKGRFQKQLSLSDFASGVYLIKAIGSSYTYTKRLILQTN